MTMGGIVEAAIEHVYGEFGLNAARYTAMHELIEAGYSGRQALEWFRKYDLPDVPTGLGMRIQTFYQFWTPLVEMHARAGGGVLIGDTDYPGAESMATTPFDQTRGYNFLTKIHGEDIKTGEMVERWVNVGSDVLLTKGQIEAEAKAIVMTDLERYRLKGEPVGEFWGGQVQKGVVLR